MTHLWLSRFSALPGVGVAKELEAVTVIRGSQAIRMEPMMQRSIFVLSTLVALSAWASAGTVMTLAPLNSWSGDGWLAPDEDASIKLSTGNLERGLAYNPTTDHVILLSRSAGIFPQILNGQTAGYLGSLKADAAALTGGGTFLGNMIGCDDDGRIYMCNLATSTASRFSVYRWNDETLGVNPVLVSATNRTLPRFGDTFDVFGSGSNVSIVAGAGTGGSGVTVSNDGGATFTDYPSASSSGKPDYRLGITFTDGTHVFGCGTDNAGAGGENNARYFDIAANTILGDATLNLGSERLLDYAIVDGVPVLATQETTSGDHRVRVYDCTNPLAPQVKASFRTDAGTVAANGNGTGQVKFGKITGNKAVIYAMSTNMGIQAMELTVLKTQPISGTLNLTSVNSASVDGVWASGLTFRYELRSGSTVAASGTFTCNSSFGYTINAAVAPGTYDLYIIGKPFLGKLIPGVATSSTGINVTLLDGDVDGDNSVTVFDYGVLSDYFDKTNADSDWTTVGANGSAPADADLDGDGAVTVFDYGILSDDFDLSGDA